MEAGPSAHIEGRAQGFQEGKSKRPSTAVSPIIDDGLGITNISEGIRPFGSDFATNEDKKSFAALSLPNYDIWAKRRKPSYRTWKKLKWIYEEKILRDILRQRPIPPSTDGRHIDLDASRKIPLVDERTGNPYIGNTIRSSRYTLWNFLPRQLFFQFSKMANAYFLLVSILQMIPGLSTTGSYTTIAPLLVFVTISMAKEGYDDLRRYKLDKIENNKQALVLHAYEPVSPQVPMVTGSSDSSNLPAVLGPRDVSPESDHVGSQGDVSISIPIDGPKHWASLKWKDVKVGDIIKLQRNDAVPADMVLLHADGANGIAYIETMALDGETNLKSKQAPAPLAHHCGSLDDLAACRAEVVVEDPNLDLYNFDGRVRVDDETLPLTTNEVVLRGSTLRNTSNAIGIVINTGEECKIRMNANKKPSHQSAGDASNHE